MSDVYAPFVEQILEVAQRQREADIHHHGEADDFRRRLEISERIAHHKTLRNRGITLEHTFL